MIQTKGEAERRFIREWGIDAYREWVKATGSSEFHQQQTIAISQTLTVIHYPKADDRDRIEAIQSLRTIKPIQAYRAMSVLPRGVVQHAPIDTTEEEFRTDNSFWVGVASWLMVWETKSQSLLEMTAKFWQSYRTRARVAEQRFLMIRALTEKKILSPELFPEPALPWLLCEAAIARQRLQNLDRNPGKRASHDRRVQNLSALKDFSSLIETRTAQDLDDALLHFDLIVETIARRFAEADPRFDQYDFKPYIEMATRWNRVEGREPQFQLIRKQQRDRKPRELGKKRKS